MWQFDAIGTSWQVDTHRPLPDAVVGEVRECIADFDRTWSRFRPDADISRLRHGASAELGADAEAIFELYDRLNRATAGAVNPCVGASLERLGYDPVYSLTARGEPLPAVAWDDCTREGSRLTVPGPVVLDIGAVGKGYLAQQVADIIVGHGIDCTVDASGDIVHRTGSPLRVGLEHPMDPSLAVGVVEVPDGAAICGSARNRRAWGAGLHHVIDPRTGVPTTGVAATWVLARDAAVADGCSTALFFCEPADLDEFDLLGWVVHHDDQTLSYSESMNGEFFS